MLPIVGYDRLGAHYLHEVVRVLVPKSRPDVMHYTRLEIEVASSVFSSHRLQAVTSHALRRWTDGSFGSRHHQHQAQPRRCFARVKDLVVRRFPCLDVRAEDAR